MSKPYPYERLSLNNENLSALAADRAIESGWKYSKFPPLEFSSKPVDWALRNNEERSRNFRIHCWDMLSALLAAYSDTGESRFIQPALAVALDWVKNHPTVGDDRASPFAWSDMAVGMRSYKLAFLIDVAAHERLLTGDDRNVLWYSLLNHHNYLSDDSKIAFHNNHGYYQIAGQLAMGRRFAKSSPLLASAMAQGRQRLFRMLEQQFSDDGIHREHSPDYHRMVYETLLSILQAGLIERDEIIDIVKKVERALSWFILPSQRIANFGDSDSRDTKYKARAAERKWYTDEMKFFCTDGEIGKPPSSTIAAFKGGGYFVVRRPSKLQPQVLAKSSYLAQIAAFHSRTHKHADDLSFIWSDHGTDILVDAGRYGYIGKTEQGSKLWMDGYWYSDPKRVYCESTRAHNTVEIDGLNYQRKGRKPFGSAISRWTETESGVVAVETEVRQFQTIRHARVLIFDPGSWLIVYDWLLDNDEKPHDFKQWFHLAPDLSCYRLGSEYKITLPTLDVPLRVAPLLPDTNASFPVIAREGDDMQGWLSPKERELIPNYAFCYEVKSRPAATMATLFVFSKEDLTIKDMSIANVSGRNATFRWKDDAGKHTVKLSRPLEGDLTVVVGR